MQRCTQYARPSALWASGRKTVRGTPYPCILPQPSRGSDRTALGRASGLAWQLSRSPQASGKKQRNHSALGSGRHGALGNEAADKYAKAAAESKSPDGAVPDDYRWETSLSHIARVATEARSRTAAQ